MYREAETFSDMRINLVREKVSLEAFLEEMFWYLWTGASRMRRRIKYLVVGRMGIGER